MKSELKTWMESKELDTMELEKRYKNGDTALILAAREGNLPMVEALLEAGADKNALNSDNNGAIWAACFADSLPVIQTLADAGVNLDTQNVNGATALIYTASAGKEAMVKALLDAGADTTLKTLDDYTALESATTPKILKMLKEAHRA